MILVKSFSVGNGDMFYIRHGTDNFSIIDCCMPAEDRDRIVSEVTTQSYDKRVVRVISSHPDNDHILGLEALDDELEIRNFYCVENSATKQEVTDDFRRYCELRDSDKAYYLYSGCSRRWMNKESTERGSAGLNVLWPDTENEHYRLALEVATNGGSPNNISPIVRYSLKDGVSMLWMGDLESEFMRLIKDDLALPQTDVVFAPHHGRASGKIPESILQDLAPRIVVIGEAPSEHLNYYEGYDTITQNSAGDISFECSGGVVHVYASKEYSVDYLDNLLKPDTYGYYVGSLSV